MNERKDNGFSPQWPVINFGDGTWARVIEIKPNKDSQGIDTNIMKIIPGPELIAIYDIPDDMMDDQHHIRIEIPCGFMSNVSISPAFPTYWCYVNIFGKDCPGTQFLKGFVDSQKILGYQKIMDSLKAENAWLKEKYYKASTNNFKWLNEISSVKDMMNINIQSGIPNQPQVVGPLRDQ